MRKTLAVIAVLVLAGALLFAGGKKDNSKVLKVGATPEPHASMLNLIVDDMAKAGYKLEVIEFTDYVTPNRALEDGQIQFHVIHNENVCLRGVE